MYWRAYVMQRLVAGLISGVPTKENKKSKEKSKSKLHDMHEGDHVPVKVKGANEGNDGSDIDEDSPSSGNSKGEDENERID